jgi:hypothetical protein
VFIIVKTLFIQNKITILKTARQKHKVTYKNKPIRITDFSISTLKARRAGNDAFVTLKKNDC